LLDKLSERIAAHRLVTGAILAAAAYAVFSGSLANGFVYDDNPQILQNAFILNSSLWKQIFTGSVWSFQGGRTNFYRPLQFACYWILYRIGRPNPAVFHLLNLLVYAASVWLVYRLGRKFFNHEAVPLTGALLWALHPVHVEAVAWISALPDVGFAFLSLISLLCFVQAERRGEKCRLYHLFAVVSFFVALFFKEMALGFPFLLLAYWFFLGSSESWVRRATRWIPYVAATIVYLALRRQALGYFTHGGDLWNVSPRVAESALGLLGQNTRILFWPTHLNVFRMFYLDASLHSPWLWITLLCLGGTMWLRQREPTLAFLITWWPVTLLPTLDIRQAFSKANGSFTVLLGVPLWQSARANAFPPGQAVDPRVKLLYRVTEVECADENTGENSQPIQVRKLNARLMLEHEDTSDMETLPLLRIARAAGEDVGLPREDAEFVPPCLLMNGSPVLRELVRDLSAQIEASRKELVVQMTRGGFNLEQIRGLQLEQMLRLRSLNRFSGRLPALVAAPGVTPLEWYLELRDLLGELSALYPDRDAFEVANFDHERPYLAFRELSNKIRNFLRGAVAPSYLKVPFKDVDGKPVANLLDEHFNRPSSYFLAIKTKIDPVALASYVVDLDRFKLMPLSLADRAIRGIELKEERHPPLELPAASDLHYFRLEHSVSARMWQQVQMEKAAAIRWKSAELDWAGVGFTLYMTVPSDK